MSSQEFIGAVTSLTRAGLQRGRIKLINPCPLVRQFRITGRQWAGCCQQTPCRSDEPLRRHLFLLFLRPYFHLALQFLLYLLIGVFGGEGKNTT